MRPSFRILRNKVAKYNNITIYSYDHCDALSLLMSRAVQYIGVLSSVLIHSFKLRLGMLLCDFRFCVVI